jgi:hypothetical protein
LPEHRDKLGVLAVYECEGLLQIHGRILQLDFMLAISSSGAEFSLPKAVPARMARAAARRIVTLRLSNTSPKGLLAPGTNIYRLWLPF